MWPDCGRTSRLERTAGDGAISRQEARERAEELQGDMLAGGGGEAVRTFSAAGWGGVPAFLPSNVGNATIGPETTSELELGFEGAFIDDRLALDFTYFVPPPAFYTFSMQLVF